MKSVIVDIRGKYAAALSEDGCVIKVRNHNYAIGQEIEMRNPVNISSKKIAVFAASAAAVLALCGIGGYTYYSPYSYVSIDVNPSIEFTLNRFDRVLHAKGTNDDGDMILTRVVLENLSNKSIGEAIAITVEEISELGYFNGDEEGGIVIATSAKDPRKADKLANELKDTINKELNDDNIVVYDENKDDDNSSQNDAHMGTDDGSSDTPDGKKKEASGNVSRDDNDDNGNENDDGGKGKAVTVEVISVVKERVELARELGVTPGKLHLVEKLQQYADGYEVIDAEEWLRKPVKEIMKATKDFKNAFKNRQEETLSEDENETADDPRQSGDSSGDSPENAKSDKHGSGKNNKGSGNDKKSASGQTAGRKDDNRSDNKDDDRDRDRNQDPDRDNDDNDDNDDRGSKSDKKGNNSNSKNNNGNKDKDNDKSNNKDKDKNNNSNGSKNKDKDSKNGNGKGNSGWKAKGNRKRP